MANRPKHNRAEQDDAPNMKMIKPAKGGVHATVGTTLHPAQEAQSGPQAGQNPRT